jgi:hypothetical protein
MLGWAALPGTDAFNPCGMSLSACHVSPLKIDWSVEISRLFTVHMHLLYQIASITSLGIDILVQQIGSLPPKICSVLRAQFSEM